MIYIIEIVITHREIMFLKYVLLPTQALTQQPLSMFNYYLYV